MKIPVHATRLYPWQDFQGQPVRPFTGSTWSVGSAQIAVEGAQSTVDTRRAVVVSGLDGVELTPELARECAAAIVAAADEAAISEPNVGAVLATVSAELSFLAQRCA